MTTRRNTATPAPRGPSKGKAKSAPKPVKQQEATVAAQDADSNRWHGRVVDRSLAKAMERSLARAQQFVDATVSLMEERGSINFTVQEVCDTAGQSLRTFYMHFTGKDELLLAVYEELFSGLVARITRAVEQHDQPLDRLATAITSAVADAMSATAHRRARDQALAQFRLDLVGNHSVDVAAVQQPYVRLLCQLVEEAIAGGELPAQEPEHAAYVISALKSTFLHSALLGNDVGVEAPTVGELMRFCIRGIGGDVTRLTVGDA